MKIQKTAVLGAGKMGSAIAAQMANAGADVILLDIVPEDAGNRRNKLAEEAIDRMLEKERSPFTYPDNARRITVGNFEDDMDKLGVCDWIVEAVVEKADIKQDLFRRVDEHRKPGSIVSSNTSTITLKKLKEGHSPELRGDMFITHFFNPPRQMQLMELVTDKTFEDDEKKRALIEFADLRLGKTVIEARDTPGFIANRLGLFWMLTGLQQALEKNVPVALADAAMGKNLGFPATGIFGLFDIVGVDLMRTLGRSLRDQLPEDDGYHVLDRAMTFLDTMLDEWQAKRFYKRENGKKLCLNLQTGAYEEPPAFHVEEHLRLADILEKKTEAADYARAVLLRTLNYACACVADIADSVEDADTAMRLGFNWKRGPFEMIDTLGNGEPGPERFIQALEKDGLIPANFLQRARSGPFYKTHRGQLFYLLPRDGYKPRTFSPQKWRLDDIARLGKPVIEGKTARLRDVGDGICCLELTGKMNTISPETFEIIEHALETVEKQFTGLIIGDDDKDFSAGFDLKFVLRACEKEWWDDIEDAIRQGQKTMMSLKKAPFPVVAAAYGRALGGGCELILHCDGVQAHIESHIGLVEPRIGLVPAWGGCTELLFRHLNNVKDEEPALMAIERLFDDIGHARVSNSAQDARDQLYFRSNFAITMNRERLLADAKRLCLTLARNYEPPQNAHINIPDKAQERLAKKIDALKAEKDWDPTREEALRHLAFILSGGASEKTDYEEGEILNLEFKAFMTLIKSQQTIQKIRKVL